MRNVNRSNKRKSNKLIAINRFWILVGITLAILGVILVFIKNDPDNNDENIGKNEVKETETYVLEIPNQNPVTEPMAGVDKRW